MAAKKRIPMFASLRAKAGATVLDIFRPGWAEDIDLVSLDLGDCQSCVLGQLYGDYEEGAVRLFAATEDEPREAAARAGFAVNLGRDPRLTYPALTGAWREEIGRRQRQAARA